MTYWSDARRRFNNNKLAKISAYVLLIIVLLAVFVPVISPYTYDGIDLLNTNQAPTIKHLLARTTLGAIFLCAAGKARASVSSSHLWLLLSTARLVFFTAE
ncbi:MAG: hypothetical protein R2912_09770 [Eubacteriales bacterium]